ncbi:hypothetical protein P3S67_014741 [Capsicum chacoense]
MASKGHGNERRKKAKKGPDNLPTGQYTTPPPSPVTTTLQSATTNIPPPPRATISLPNAFFMPPPSHQFHPSPQNSLCSSSSYVPSTSSTPSLSGMRIGGPSTSTSPSIDSATASNATAAATQILKFKEVVEYDGNERLIIVPDGNGRGLKVALRIKEHLYEAWKNLEKPDWLNADVWVKFLEKWDIPKYSAEWKRAKANRASSKGG